MSANRQLIIGLLMGMQMLLAACPVFAGGVDVLASIGEYAKESFSPQRNELFEIPVTVPIPETLKAVQVEIRTADDDLVRTLEIELVPGISNYPVVWDGRDSDGRIVPDEAYHLLLKMTDANGDISVSDARKHSGGEEVYDFEKQVRQGTIEYSLPAASRMLVRAGIKNGPMLRTIVDWEPRGKGFHAEHWDGKDADDVVPVEQNPQVGYLIVGYRLPDNAIITYGNADESYREYRERRGYPHRKARFDNRLLERHGKVIRQEFYNPLLQQKSPRIAVTLLSKESREPIDAIAGFSEVLTQVDLDPLDELYLDQERYEISFFIDNEFIAEEEQGFVPFVWRWSPGRLGIEPGDHVLTVNVSGYNGQVGVRNLAFSVIEDDQ